MAGNVAPIQKLTNLPFYEERVDLACAFRWTARLNMHEAVANHFSLAVNENGTQFLMNPSRRLAMALAGVGDSEEWADLLALAAALPEEMMAPFMRYLRRVPMSPGAYWVPRVRPLSVVGDPGRGRAD